MPSVFLSYSRQDLDFAVKLERELRKQGVEVWRDESGLVAGDPWADAAGVAIKEADCFILVWSRHAAESNYVKLEWNCALTEQIRSVTCFVDDTPPPYLLKGLTVVDGRDFQTAVAKILAAINRQADATTRPPAATSVHRVRKAIGWGGLLLISSLLAGWYALIDRQPDSNITPLLTAGNGLSLEFVPISAGSFQMGSEREGEGPVRTVRIDHPFELGKYEVTQGQWEEWKKSGPLNQKDSLPVERVSWDDVQEFLFWLNQGQEEWLYRLPTEAEWEYAARAGSTLDGPLELDEVAWYRDNSGDRTHAVGQKAPNRWGLFDMHGNVSEWVQDAGDPGRPTAETYRIARGGGWNNPTASCRSSNRFLFKQSSRLAFLGFRVLRERRR